MHQLTDSCLAHLECLECVRLRLELFSAAVHSTTREINLAQSVLALRVLALINLAKNLQVGQTILSLFSCSICGMREFAGVISHVCLCFCTERLVITSQFMSHCKNKIISPIQRSRSIMIFINKN
jgi:hypothetical protein